MISSVSILCRLRRRRGVVTDRLPEAELLSLAAAVERESEHPLAQAVVRRADGDSAAAGARQSASRRSLATARWRQWAAAEGKTVVCVAVDGRAAGLLAIADAPRPHL